MSDSESVKGGGGSSSGSQRSGENARASFTDFSTAAIWFLIELGWEVSRIAREFFSNYGGHAYSSDQIARKKKATQGKQIISLPAFFYEDDDAVPRLDKKDAILKAAIASTFPELVQSWAKGKQGRYIIAGEKNAAASDSCVPEPKNHPFREKLLAKKKPTAKDVSAALSASLKLTKVKREPVDVDLTFDSGSEIDMTVASDSDDAAIEDGWRKIQEKKRRRHDHSCAMEAKRLCVDEDMDLVPKKSERTSTQHRPGSAVSTPPSTFGTPKTPARGESASATSTPSASSPNALAIPDETVDWPYNAVAGDEYEAIIFAVPPSFRYEVLRIPGHDDLAVIELHPPVAPSGLLSSVASFLASFNLHRATHHGNGSVLRFIHSFAKPVLHVPKIKEFLWAPEDFDIKGNPLMPPQHHYLVLIFTYVPPPPPTPQGPMKVVPSFFD